ncbi:MAG: OmpH family outer membrane protein [Alphaproteobacteria bacterium]
MKQTTTFFAAVIAVFMFGAQPALANAPANAAGATTGVKFGIMDLDGVMGRSAAGEDILKTANAKRKEYEGQIAKEEAALKKQKEDIIAKRAKMTEAEFENQRKAFEKKASDAFKLVQERKQTLDNGVNQSMKKLREEVLKITAEIARARGLDAVFSDESVILAERGFDISDEVLAELNKRVKKIPVNFTPPKKK